MRLAGQRIAADAQNPSSIRSCLRPGVTYEPIFRHCESRYTTMSVSSHTSDFGEKDRVLVGCLPLEVLLWLYLGLLPARPITTYAVLSITYHVTYPVPPITALLRGVSRLEAAQAFHSPTPTDLIQVGEGANPAPPTHGAGTFRVGHAQVWGCDGKPNDVKKEWGNRDFGHLKQKRSR